MLAALRLQLVILGDRGRVVGGEQGRVGEGHRGRRREADLEDALDGKGRVAVARVHGWRRHELGSARGGGLDGHTLPPGREKTRAQAGE